jgi:hypothetical protein
VRTGVGEARLAIGPRTVSRPAQRYAGLAKQPVGQTQSTFVVAVVIKAVEVSVDVKLEWLLRLSEIQGSTLSQVHVELPNSRRSL